MRGLSSKSQILYIGNEPTLSKASSALLRGAGYQVRTTSPSHAAEVVREGHFSVVVFCATLSLDEMESVVTLLGEGEQVVPIVSVQVGHLGDGPHPASSKVVDAMQGPEALVGAVQSLTRPHQKAS
jgi:CheY-like chemotaxis protein